MPSKKKKTTGPKWNAGRMLLRKKTEGSPDGGMLTIGYLPLPEGYKLSDQDALVTFHVAVENGRLVLREMLREELPPLGSERNLSGHTADQILTCPLWQFSVFEAPKDPLDPIGS